MVLAAAVAVGALGACDPGGADPPDPPSTTAGGRAGAGSGTATVPPGLLECGKPTDTDKGLMLSELDLSTATWPMPSGFAETFLYHEENPVEEVVSTWSAEPVPAVDVLNIVNVIVYTGLDWGDLADDCGRVPVSAVEERLAGYNSQIGAEPVSEATMTTVAGQPAIEQQIHLDTYDYHGYWLFSQDQLLHAYCQWTNDETLIEAGCAELIPSIQVG